MNAITSETKTSPQSRAQYKSTPRTRRGTCKNPPSASLNILLESAQDTADDCFHFRRNDLAGLDHFLMRGNGLTFTVCRVADARETQRPHTAVPCIEHRRNSGAARCIQRCESREAQSGRRFKGRT